MSYKSIWDFGRSGITNYSVHKIGEYPSKIRPIVFHKIVERFSKEKDLILDPFGGSGTLSVEAKLQGRNSINLDINPNATDLTKEKTNKLDKVEMLSAYDSLIKDLTKERNKINVNGRSLYNNKIEKNEKMRVIQIDKEIKKYIEIKYKINTDETFINTKHTIKIEDARNLTLENESVDSIITDIPYSDMIQYSNLENDLSNIENYADFLIEVQKCFSEMVRVLKKDKYLVVFVADNRIGASRKILPLHSDVIQFFTKKGLDLFDLYIWRYYRSGGFRPFGAKPFQAMNIHTYILVFHKPNGLKIYKKNEKDKYRKNLTKKIKNNYVYK